MLERTKIRTKKWLQNCRKIAKDPNSRGIAGPFVPLIKMFCYPAVSIRTVWGIFCTLMSIAVVSSFTVTMLKYLTHVSVIRIDQTDLIKGNQPPSLTICLEEHRSSRIERTSLDLKNFGMLEGTGIVCEPSGRTTWSSQRHGKSELFLHAAHFNVTFSVSPPSSIAISVVEQVPSPANDICTTFKLNLSCFAEGQFWKLLTTRVELTQKNRNLSGPPKFIIHEADSFPLDNYGRYLYEHIHPGAQRNLFYAKSTQLSLNTGNRPCSQLPIRVLGQKFNYDQAACQWKEYCGHLHDECNCFCALEILAKITQNFSLNSSLPQVGQSCLHKCVQEQDLVLTNTSLCPYACYTTTYKKLNDVVFNGVTNPAAVELVLIQGDAIETKTEEELYSLAKLFSEIGGLSSFFFGFSCIILFDLFQACIHLWISWCIEARKKRGQKSVEVIEMKTKAETGRGEMTFKVPLSSLCYPRKIHERKFTFPYKPHCLPLSDRSPLFTFSRKAVLCEQFPEKSYLDSSLTKSNSSPPLDENSKGIAWIMFEDEQMPIIVD